MKVLFRKSLGSGSKEIRHAMRTVRRQVRRQPGHHFFFNGSVTEEFKHMRIVVQKWQTTIGRLDRIQQLVYRAKEMGDGENFNDKREERHCWVEDNLSPEHLRPSCHDVSWSCALCGKRRVHLTSQTPRSEHFFRKTRGFAKSEVKRHRLTTCA